MMQVAVASIGVRLDRTAAERQWREFNADVVREANRSSAAVNTGFARMAAGVASSSKSAFGHVASGAATVRRSLPALVGMFGRLQGQLTGLGRAALDFGSAFAATFANLERRFPQLARLGNLVRGAFSSTRSLAGRGMEGIAGVLRPGISRGRQIVGDVSNMASFAGSALRSRAGSAMAGVGEALSPASQQVGRAAAAVRNQFRAMQIQGQRVGRAIAKDFAPLTKVISDIGSQANEKMFRPLTRAAGTAATSVKNRFQQAFSAIFSPRIIGKVGVQGRDIMGRFLPKDTIQRISRFQSAVRGIGSVLGSVGRTAVQVGAQVTSGFFGAAFRRSLGLAGVALRGIRGSVGLVSRSLRGLMATMRSTLLPLAALAGGLSVLAGVGFSVKTFATFEQSMARVQALTNASTQNFGKLSDMAEKLGATTQFSASQAAEAMGNFALAGFKVNEILGAAGPTLNLAAAGQLDMATASDITAKVMRGMQIEVTELNHVVDVLAKAFTTANTDLQMLGEAMKFVGPIAKTSGKSLEETVSSLQVLSDAGLQASVAGTGLRNVFSRMAQETAAVRSVFGGLGVAIKNADGSLLPLADIIDDFNTAIEKQGKEAEVTGLAMKAFGERAGPAFAVLLGKGGEALRQYESALAGAGGTAKRIAEVQMDTLRGSFIQLASATEGAMITFGRALAPALRGIAGALQEMMPTLGEVAAEIKPLAEAMGTVLGGRIRALTGFLADNKNEFATWFQLTAEIFTNVSRLAGDVANGIANFIGNIFGLQAGVRGVADAAVEGITELLDALSLISTDPTGFAMSIGEALIGALQSGAASFLDAMKSGISSFAQTIGMTFNAAIAGLSQVFQGFIESLPLAIGGGMLSALPASLGGDQERGEMLTLTAGRRMAGSMVGARHAVRQSIERDIEAASRMTPQSEEVEGDKRVNRYMELVEELKQRAARGFISDEVFNQATNELRTAYMAGQDLPTITRAEASANRARGGNLVASLVDSAFTPLIEGLRGSAAEHFDRAATHGENAAAERERRRQGAEAEAGRERERAQLESARQFINPFTSMVSGSIATLSSQVAQNVGPAQASLFGADGLAGALGDMLGGAAGLARRGAEALFGNNNVAQNADRVLDIRGGRTMDMASFIADTQSGLFDKKDDENLRANQKTRDNTAGMLALLDKMLKDPKTIIARFGR